MNIPLEVFLSKVLHFNTFNVLTNCPSYFFLPEIVLMYFHYRIKNNNNNRKLAKQFNLFILTMKINTSKKKKEENQINFS